ncbi:TRAP transporter small permease [Paracoccus sp. P2]|uniref:TRAP transporter small permease n=1 Tax=Paracoccus sp. P2 TaxID=3248840 RepID=UPI00391FAE00
MDRMEKVLGVLTNALMWLSGICITGMMVHVFLDVLAKAVVQQPLPGTSEIVARYYMLAAVFLPLPLVEMRNSAIVVDLFYDRFGPGFQRICLVLAYIGQVAFFSLLTWRSFWDAVKAFARGEFVDGQIPITVWPSAFFLPAGFGVAALIGVFRLVQIVTRDDWQEAAAPHNQSDTHPLPPEAV